MSLLFAIGIFATCLKPISGRLSQGGFVTLRRNSENRLRLIS